MVEGVRNGFIKLTGAWSRLETLLWTYLLTEGSSTLISGLRWRHCWAGRKYKIPAGFCLNGRCCWCGLERGTRQVWLDFCNAMNQLNRHKLNYAPTLVSLLILLTSFFSHISSRSVWQWWSGSRSCELEKSLSAPFVMGFWIRLWWTWWLLYANKLSYRGLV